MSFGKPIIAPRVGGLPEVLDSDGTIFYDANDNDGLKKALEQIRSRNLSLMGEYNRRKAIKHYGWEHVSSETIKIYQQKIR